MEIRFEEIPFAMQQLCIFIDFDGSHVWYSHHKEESRFKWIEFKPISSKTWRSPRFCIFFMQPESRKSAKFSLLLLTASTVWLEFHIRCWIFYLGRMFNYMTSLSVSRPLPPACAPWTRTDTKWVWTRCQCLSLCVFNGVHVELWF